jgi:hypothetical protein
MTASWRGRLVNLIPIGIAAAAVFLILLGTHLTTLSQQASAATSGGIVYNPRTGAYVDLSGNEVSEGDAVQHDLLSSGILCPIHQLGLFGFGTSRR